MPETESEHGNAIHTFSREMPYVEATYPSYFPPDNEASTVLCASIRGSSFDAPPENSSLPSGGKSILCFNNPYTTPSLKTVTETGKLIPVSGRRIRSVWYE